ncbi:MAG: hypothetical protein JKX88_10925 [Marinicaulis sp.]|nr:hypothetical protein [Marinicaulis sp.]
MSNLNRLAKMKRILAVGLGPFVTEALQNSYGDKWRERARFPASVQKVGPLDTHALLYVIQSEWRDVFSDLMPIAARSAANAAQDGRNAEAHAIENIDDHRTLRALSGATDLIQLIGVSKEAGVLAKLRDVQVAEMTKDATSNDKNFRDSLVTSTATIPSSLPTSKLEVIQNTKPETKSSMKPSFNPHFELKIGKAYYNQGFINVGVSFAKYFGNHNTSIEIYLGNYENSVSGHVNRTANSNGTPRIMGGVSVRDWIQKNTRIGDYIGVEILSQKEICLKSLR